MTRYFTPRLFGFLRELADNNDRDWFHAHKDEYEASVRQPALDFITDAAGPLATISPHFSADSRTVGGSLFRIQRDLRFGKDKTPYKTHTGIQFRHKMAADVHAPGFYLHLEPRSCFMGVGIWKPETRVAYAIRERIDAQPDRWIAATRTPAFADVFDLAGDRLKRPPKGYEADHRLIEDLKRKDFIATSRLTQAQVTSTALMDEFIERAGRAAEFMRFLCDAVGIPF